MIGSIGFTILQLHNQQGEIFYVKLGHDLFNLYDNQYDRYYFMMLSEDDIICSPG
jgi:hypothetical protein